jgi:hypothetical protein
LDKKKMNPLANELCRAPLRRCLERTHHYTKGDGHMVPSSYMISNLLLVSRVRNGVLVWAEGKVHEAGEPSFPAVEGEDDFWDEEDEDEFGL